jgi:hypothetical protein
MIYIRTMLERAFLKNTREGWRGYTMVISNKITTWDGPTTKYQLMFYCPHDVGWTKVLELTIHGPNHFINYVGVTLLHSPNRGGQTYGCRNIPPLLIAQGSCYLVYGSMARYLISFLFSTTYRAKGPSGCSNLSSTSGPRHDSLWGWI